MQSNLELRKFVVPEVIIGKDASKLLGRYVGHFSARTPLIVTDKTVRINAWFDRIIETLEGVVDSYYIFDDVSENPKDFEAMMGAELFLSHDCDLIIAIGGGSPMDCAKCISIVSTNGGHILDYEGVDEINLPGPPLICIPTTSGTAADVSQFAIVTDSKTNVKKAIISKKVVPDLALIDPVPLMTMPFYTTACTGMDALTHAIEAYVSNAQSALTDIHALDAIQLVNEHLEKCVTSERTVADLHQMLLASTHAGFAFSNASLGAVHAMAHSLGGLLNLPHGECNSILLSKVVEVNFDAAPMRYREIAKVMGIVTGHESMDEIKFKLIDRLNRLRSNVGIPSVIAAKGIDSMLESLKDAALNDPCMVTNPKIFTRDQVGEIFEKIIG